MHLAKSGPWNEHSDGYLAHTHDPCSRSIQQARQNNPVAYLESICTLYLNDHDKDRIQEQTVLLAKVQMSIYNCHDEVLQIYGIGDELSQVENVKKNICATVSWVEEVFCSAIVDWTEVQRLYRERGFLYQNT